MLVLNLSTRQTEGRKVASGRGQTKSVLYPFPCIIIAQRHHINANFTMQYLQGIELALKKLPENKQKEMSRGREFFHPVVMIQSVNTMQLLFALWVCRFQPLFFETSRALAQNQWCCEISSCALKEIDSHVIDRYEIQKQRFAAYMQIWLDWLMIREFDFQETLSWKKNMFRLNTSPLPCA